MRAKEKSYYSVFFFLLTVCLSLFLAPQGFPQEKFRKSPPSPFPLPLLKLNPVESTTLTNGLKVSVFSQKNLPLTHIELIIMAGERHSPDSLPGLATMTTRMIGRQTRQFSQEKIQETIESLGGNFQAQTYLDYSRITLEVLAEYTDEALALLKQMILWPSFNQRSFDSLKREIYYELVRKSVNPEFLAKRLLFQLLFADHPYHKIAFSRDDIRRIQLKDVKDFFTQLYLPNNSQIIFIGDLDLKSAAKKTSHAFFTWKKQKLIPSTVPSPQPAVKMKIGLIDLPQRNDVTIFLGNLVFPQSWAETYAYSVLSHILGGTPYSRLFLRLREMKGYSYYVFSEMEILKNCALFTIRARVRPEVLEESLQEILAVIREIIVDKKIANYELEQAKSFLIGRLPVELESLDNLAFRLTSMNIYGYGNEYWQKYYSNIMSLTPDDVFQVGQKSSLLTPVITLTGNKEVILQNLKSLDIDLYDKNGKFLYTLRKGEKK